MSASSVESSPLSMVSEERGICVVDAFSTGELLAQRIHKLGYKLVLVYSTLKQECGVWSNNIQGDYEIYHTGSVEETANKIRELPFPVDHVLPGAENGVFLADELAHHLDMQLKNCISLSKARRNKFLQQETIRQKGVRAAKQILASEWDEVEAFMREWNPSPFKVIVKPNQSAGSDDVFLCTDMEQTRAAFNCINGAINSCGDVNEGVLVMEYLEGDEYVIDSVSRHGEHKVVSIWKYDKRHVNGQFNVYFGMQVCAVTSEFELALVEYSNQVLDALEINNGPSHMEVIVTKDGPRLVEVGSRCHGGHGTWSAISTAAFGYNQMDATIDAYTSQTRFDALPPFPTNPMRFGKEVFLVSYREGTIRGIPGLDKVFKCPSFLASDIGVKAGQKLHKTIDLFTMPGRVQLLHESAEQVEKDYQEIHNMLKEGRMFELVSGKELEALPEGPAEE